MRLPAANDDPTFDLAERAVYEQFDDEYVHSEHLLVDDHVDVQAIRTLKITFAFATDQADEQAWETAAAVAERALVRFLDWIRIRTEQAAVMITPGTAQPLDESCVRDGTTSDRIMTMTASRSSRLITLRFPPDPKIFDPTAADALQAELSDEPSLPERLLADAQHALWYVDPPDIGIALVLMGTALELRAFETTRRLSIATPRQIERARGFYDLISDDMTFFGRSPESDVPGLQAAVIGAYRARNRFAHASVLPDWSDASDFLKAARSLIVWMDAL